MSPLRVVAFPRLIAAFGLFLCCSVAHGQAPPRVSDPVDDAKRVTLTGNVHPMTRTAVDQGAVSATQKVNRVLVLLKRSQEQQAAFEQFLEHQQDKSSPEYQKWLTPAALGDRFGVADADIRAVTDWLTSKGFGIEKVYSGKMVIEFSGTASQIQEAFGTALHNFELNGKVYSANTGDPQIPAALAPVVGGIVSLNNFPRRHHSHLVGQMRREGQGVAKPLFTLPGGALGNIYAVGPGDFAKIYNTLPLLTQTGNPGPNNGTGQTIAIVGETNINVQDVQDFRTLFNLPANFTSANVVLNGEDPGITSTDEETEADLDVQWSGAVAPGATVLFVVSASTPASAGVDLSALYIVENNLASVMSESYGECEANLASGNTYYNEIWAEAAAQGITAMVSSGDGGSAGCDNFDTEQEATQGIAVSGFASTPYNVSVGATDFDQINKWSVYWSSSNDPVTGTSALGYIPEIPWNNSCAQIGASGCSSPPQGSLNIVAGSGGPSILYSKPAWQLGVKGMPSDNHRDQPDVSLFGSSGFTDSAYIVCQQDQTSGQSCQTGNTNFLLVGGTSAASPSFAGVMALVDQSQQITHGGTGRQGNANYTLYALSKQSGASCASASPQLAGCVFNDVVKGNSEILGKQGVGTNSVPCSGGSLSCNSSIVGANGVLVDETGTEETKGSEAWLAQTGYDLATGLGTLNVANLVAKWSSASSVSTSTTLTMSRTSGITHGSENVGVTMEVSATSGTPTGSVSLIADLGAGQTRAVGQFTLDGNGNASGQTNDLPGGSYSVYAHYAGDGVNAPSDSTPVSVTVAKESSQVFIVIPTFDNQGNQTNGNANSIAYGTRYILRMYVTDQHGSASTAGPPSGTCFPANLLNCPTGVVTLMANGSSVDGGSFALNNAGYTRDISPTLTGGTYPLMAQYGGDASFSASIPATDSITITPSPMQFFEPVTVISNPIIVNEPVQLVAGVLSQAPYGIAPTGTITFFDGSTALTSQVNFSGQAGSNGLGQDASATAYTSPIFTTAGPHTLTAKYGGDVNYAAVTSGPTTFNVLNPTTVTAVASPASVNYGQSVTVTVTVNTTSKGPTMTGTVQFAGILTSMGNVTIATGTDASGNQMLTATGTVVPSNTFPIEAQYSGDSYYEAMGAESNSVNVILPDFSLPGQATLNETAGQNATGTLNVTPLSNISSTVNMTYAGAVPMGTNVTLSPSSVSLNGSAVPVTINLTSGAASNVATATRTVRKSTAAVDPFGGTRGPLGGALAGLAIGLAMMIKTKKRLHRLAFASAAMLAFAVLGCGGGGSSGGGTGGGATLAQSTISLASSSAKVAATASVTLTASVTSSSAQPVTGQVNFFQSGGSISTVQLVNGQATYVVPAPDQPGTLSFTASYSGDAHNMTSQTANPLVQSYTGSVQGTIFGTTAGGQLTHQVPLTINVQ